MSHKEEREINKRSEKDGKHCFDHLEKTENVSPTNVRGGT